MQSGLTRAAARTLGLDDREVFPALLGALAFFLLFAGYFMLRPVRETMGIAGGVRNLQWLFTATFVATLAALPAFGWAAARIRRDRVSAATLAFFSTNLLVFAAAMAWRPEDVFVARAFYVWLSVFSLLAVSVVWSLLADLFSIDEAKRLFAVMAAGASAGGLVGPLLGLALVGTLGHEGLLVLAAGLLLGTVATTFAIQRWRAAQPLPANAARPPSEPLGGSVFAGATMVARSPFLMGTALFVVLLASTTTFLYFEQARVVEATFPNPEDQTRVFATIDTIVQTLAILTQVFFTGRIAKRLGVGVLLVSVPLLIAMGFVWLAIAPGFYVLATVMIARRAGEYALVRPGREILFTLVPPGQKYKAKNFIDTVVYRGADAVSGWAKALVDMLATQPAVASIIGAGVALTWAATGAFVTRQASREAAKDAGSPPARG